MHPRQTQRRTFGIRKNVRPHVVLTGMAGNRLCLHVPTADIHRVLDNLIHTSERPADGHGTIHHLGMCRIYGHAAAVTTFDIRCLVEMPSAMRQEDFLPGLSVPIRIIVIVFLLVSTDFDHGYHRMPLLVGSHLPHPVTHTGCMIHDRYRIIYGILLRTVHLKRSVGNG